MKKRIKSFGYAGRGIWSTLRSEPNMKIHLGVAIIVICCGFSLSINTTEWILCLICFGLVLGSEMLNTAIENVVDLASPSQNQLAGRAKDVAAGAVLICSIISVIIGLLIFVPKVMIL